jgi:hypothetical protein
MSSIFNGRLLTVAALAFVLFSGAFWQRSLKSPSASGNVVNAAAQAVQYHFTNDYLKLGAEARPVELVEVALPNAKVAVETPFVGDLSTFDNAALIVKNTSGQKIQQVGLRLTMYGLDGKQADVVHGHQMGDIEAGQTKSFSLVPTALLLRSQSARIARSVERVEAQLDYVEFADRQLWHYGLMHVPTEGFTRGRAWVAKGREAAAARLFQEYEKLSGQAADTPSTVQQFFTEKRARSSAKMEQSTANCWQYVGAAWFDCGSNGYTGCETMTDVGNYGPPFDMRYNAEQTWCFAMSWPYPNNCWTYNVWTSWATSDPCY